MKITGLITEYNPFHNGHVHHIEEAKKLTGADRIIVVMSGDFVQRGTPAVMDWASRTKSALLGGADLVLGLPTLFSVSSAEVFARSAIALLHLLGAVDNVVFGTELGDTAPLYQIAEVLNNEPESFSTELRSLLRTGVSYPKARAMALETHFGGSIDRLEELLATPNNILGIEYLRSILALKSSLRPVSIKRWHTDYHSEKVYEDVASATAIRKMLSGPGGPEQASAYVPAYVSELFRNLYGVTMPIDADDLSSILQYCLVTHKDSLDSYLDFTPTMKDRVNRLLPKCMTFSEWADALNTKDLTLTRTRRALLHVILGIRNEDLREYAEEDYCMYARILGFRKGAENLLSELKRHTALPIISKMADAKNLLNEKALRLLSGDVYASDLYRNAVYQKYGTLIKDDYTEGIVML